MSKRWKKLTEETVHVNPWWTYKHDTCEKPDGNVGDYYYGEERGSAMVIPVLASGKIVLVLQHRYLEDKQSIEFPGGGIMEDETAKDAAKRELLEETGCAGEEYIYLGKLEALNGFFKSSNSIFFCALSEQRAQALDETEDIEVLERSPQEFEDMVQKNEISDGKTLAAWAMARHHIFGSV